MPEAWLDFDGWVASLISLVNGGDVTTYGAVARALGDVGAARAVAARASMQDAGHRLVSAEGLVRDASQARMLRQEGVGVRGGAVRDLRVSEVRWTRGSRPMSLLRSRQAAMARSLSLDGEWTDASAGFDVSYDGDVAVGALTAGEEAFIGVAVPPIPYIPTYLGFREAGAFAACVRDAGTDGPVLVDGNGTLHPRGFGSACHLGVAAGIPTVGVAKSLLCGEVRGRGVFVGDRLAGWEVRPDRAKPLYASAGHLCSPASARRLAERDARMGEEGLLRRAHREATAARRRGAGALLADARLASGGKRL